jgi:DUF4097 and DUF4098 domain-containing protein YvlB
VGQRVEQRDILTNQTVSALTVNAGAGDVTVRTGGQANTVEVIRKGRSSTPLAVLGPANWQGSTLVLDCGDSCNLDYEIRVPDGVNVTAETGSGDMELEGALGAVTLQAGSGDVDGNLAARTVATRTGSGDVALRLGIAPEQLTANTGSGDVDLSLPDAQTYLFDTRTGSGDIDNDLPQTGTADHRVQIQTGSGDITIRAG